MRIKLIMIIAVAFIGMVEVSAGHDEPITFKQLPVKAQQFIKKHFPKSKVALAKREREAIGMTYDVIFTNGNKLEFKRNGEWTDVDCKSSPVPNAIVPNQILNYVRKNYPGQKIYDIERRAKYYEISLSNKVEIKFNMSFQVIDIDF